MHYYLFDRSILYIRKKNKQIKETMLSSLSNYLFAGTSISPLKLHGVHNPQIILAVPFSPTHPSPFILIIISPTPFIHFLPSKPTPSRFFLSPFIISFLKLPFSLEILSQIQFGKCVCVSIPVGEKFAPLPGRNTFIPRDFWRTLCVTRYSYRRPCLFIHQPSLACWVLTSLLVTVDRSPSVFWFATIGHHNIYYKQWSSRGGTWGNAVPPNDIRTGGTMNVSRLAKKCKVYMVSWFSEKSLKLLPPSYFETKMPQILFRLGLRMDLVGEFTVLTDPLAGFKGLLRREGMGWRTGGKGKEGGEGKKRERRGGKVMRTSERSPSSKFDTTPPTTNNRS